MTTTFGRYEVLDTLCLSPHRAVYTARLLDDPSGGATTAAERARRYCVKVFTPPAPSDPDEPSWETQYFLDRARTQRHVAASGGRHWAVVHDLGATPQGAYVVVDYQPLSVQKLIDGKVAVGAAALHHVADGVVRGLVELREIAARSHGNLTAGNVRFAGQGAPAETPVVLSDPAQAHVARKEGEAGDLQALGRIIYELVTHRPFEGLAGPINAPEESREPVPPGPEWSRLGPQGEPWRLLCGELLTRQIGGRAANLLRAGLALEPLQPKKVRKPHLPSVSLPRVRLPRFRRKPRAAAPAASPTPRRGRRVVRRVFTLATTVVVLLAAGVGVMALLQARAREEIRRERAAWYGAFEKALADPARRQQYVSDEGLRPILEDLDRADLAAYREPAAAAAPTDLRSRIDFRGPQAAAAALRRAREGLSPAGWKRLGWAADLQRRYANRGWRQPADYLAKLVKAAEPGAGGADVAAGIDRLLQVAPRLEQGAPAAEQAWQHLDESSTKLELSHDETLRALGAYLRSESAAVVELTDAGFAHLDAVNASADRAAQLAQVLDRAGRGEVDLARMAADFANRIDPAHVRPGDADLWLRESAAYVVRRHETEQAAAELKAKLAEAESDVVAANLPAFRKERQAVDAALAEFAQRPFVARDFDGGGEFASQQKQLDARIATLAERFRQTPEQWVDALPALATTSPRVNAFWDQWKQSLRGKSAEMARDRRLLRAAQRRAENLRGALAELDKFFADVPKGLSEAFAKEAASRRDAELGKLLAAFDPENPQPDWPKAQAASDEFGKWTLDLSDLDRDFAQFRAKELATADDRPDEKWRFTQFWQDPAIQRLVKADLERIARLQAVSAQPRDELIKAATEAPQAEVALAAWRRLARQPAVEPAWPSRAGELEAERQIRERLAGLLAKLKNPDEAKGPLDEMQKAAPEQWRRFVAGANGEAMLKSAWDLRRAFGAGTTADVDQLPPAARYNLWLFLARQQLASGNAADDAAVQRVVEGVQASAKAMDERERPAEVRDLLARLGDFGRREAFAGAAVGDTFRLPLAGVDPPLEFRRVEPSDDGRSRPFYLGTTEVTLGQYAAAVTSLNAWNDVQALPWGARLGQPDVRRGPRVWEWIADDANAGAGGPPHMAAPLKWMAADDQNDFNTDFRAQKFNRMLLSEQVGGNPSLRHPMQQISAQAAMHFAALLGCRLPTGGEWKQANEANRAALAAAGVNPREAAAVWNLKDRTWSNQYQYLIDPRRARNKWPDMGAFGVAEPSSAGNRPEDDSRAENDGTLLFRPVSPLAARGAAAVPFQDLVGNVAEFVCDAPEAFADLQGKPSADAVRSAAERAKGAWYVIGGSALSPKYVPVDEPLPLRRTDEGYADVGLRLAFTAPARSSAERLKWALGDAARGERGYVWPAQAKAAAPKASPARTAG